MDTSQYQFAHDPDDGSTVLTCTECEPGVGRPADMFEAMGLMTRHHWSTHATAISLPQEPARVPGDQRSHLRARETHEEYLIRTGRWSG